MGGGQPRASPEPIYYGPGGPIASPTSRTQYLVSPPNGFTGRTKIFLSENPRNSNGAVPFIEPRAREKNSAGSCKWKLDGAYYMYLVYSVVQ